MGTNAASDVVAGKKPRRRKWRWVRRIYRGIKILILLVILLAVGYVLLTNHQGEKRLQKTLEDLRARGLPTSLADLSSDDETAGDTEDGTRYYLAAFELASTSLVWESELPFAGGGDLPDLAKPIHPELATRLRLFIQQERDSFALVEQARTFRTYRYDINVLNAFFGGIRSLTGMRFVVQFQCARSLHHQAESDPAKAIDACVAGVNVNLSFCKHSGGSVLLARGLVAESLLRAVEQTLSRTTPDRADLQVLRSRMLLTAATLDPAEAIKWDIAWLADDAQHVRRYLASKTHAVEKHLASRSYAEWRQFTKEFGLSELEPYERGRTRLILDLANVLAVVCPGFYELPLVYEINKAIADYDVARKSTASLATDANRVLRETEDQTSNQAGEARGRLAYVEGRARMKVGATALAVECYRIEKGTWPERLTDLNLKDDELTDPFDGKPLKYRKTEDGCVVYSVGRNQQDDHGVFDYNQDKDDIAFRLFDVDKRNKP